jgi:hypothetical protein
VNVEIAPARPRLARRIDGHLTLGLAGAEIVCLPSGALWLVADRVLVVADLHLEKGSSYARRGQMLPPYDTRDTLDRLETVTRATAPRAVILLGDTFHDAGAESRLDPDDHARIGSLAAGRGLIWVVGNHDRAGPRLLPGEVVSPTSPPAIVRPARSPGISTPAPVSRRLAGAFGADASPPMASGSFCRRSAPWPGDSRCATRPSRLCCEEARWPWCWEPPACIRSPGRRCVATGCDQEGVGTAAGAGAGADGLGP